MKRIIVAVTGASGSIYATRLVDRLCAMEDIQIHLVISPWASQVMESESAKTSTEWVTSLPSEKVIMHKHEDLAASISSGSFRTHAMVIVPCSMGTLGAIASGLASNLIERAASVCLKERNQLILVARESPLSAIHLENMVKLSHAGAVILPPMPAFYTQPKTIEDLVDTTIDRIIDSMNLDDGKAKRWRDT